MNQMQPSPISTQTPPQLFPWTVSPEARSSYEKLSQLAEQVACFDPINLKAMDQVALLNRIDIKFVMTTRQLLNALALLRPDYWMLDINGQRLNHYRTLYFDTPSFELYHAHVNQRPERYKVRSREYIESNLAFLEVKHRTRKDRTIKERLRTTYLLGQLTPLSEDWLSEVSPLEGGRLEPKLWNTFTRMTLVSKLMHERVTLDIDLAFSSGKRQVRLGGLAIAEVKMEVSRLGSPFITAMRCLGVHMQGFSKYAVGVALLYEGVKKNPIKPKLLQVEKIMKGMV